MQRVPSNLGLLIAIPTLGRLQPLAWGLAYKSLNAPINYNANTMVIYGNPVDIARNAFADKALELNAKYVFFLGDDVVPPGHTLKQLIYRMEQNPQLGVVGGVYCSKCEPSAPLVFRGNGAGTYWDWKVGEFFEITGIGMDCTLVRTEVFKKLSKPFFKTSEGDQYLDGVNHAEHWTEDLYFCKKVLEETDYKIYCDAAVICEHYDGNKAYTLPEGSLPKRRLEVKKDKRAVDLGCGPINRSEQYPEYELVRVDIRDECEPDYRCDVRMLPFANEEYDLVFSSHVLEHFERNETESILTEWLRILKPGGKFHLVLPNIQWTFDKSRDVEVPDKQMLDVLYGAQSNEYDIHKTGFTASIIKELFKKFPLSEPTFEYTGFNMIVKSEKV